MSLCGETTKDHYREEHHPHCLIIQTLDGTYHATVGAQAPATGRLTEFELAEGCRAAFFRAHNIIWPMPVRGFGSYYTSGYEGTGPDELIEAVTKLRRTADADLAENLAESPTTPAPAALSQLIHNHEPPLLVSEAELDDLLARSRRPRTHR